MPDSFAHERETVKQAIKDAVGPRLSTWYRRVITANKPTILINEPQELPAAGESFTSQGGPFVRVVEQPTLWQEMGQIPVRMSRNTGFTQVMGALGGYKVGGYYGVLSTDYDVRIGDHLIDSDNREYVVISSVAESMRIFRRIGLEYLPAAGI